MNKQPGLLIGVPLIDSTPAGRSLLAAAGFKFTPRLKVVWQLSRATTEGEGETGERRSDGDVPSIGGLAGLKASQPRGQTG